MKSFICLLFYSCILVFCSCNYPQLKSERTAEMSEVLKQPFKEDFNDFRLKDWGLQAYSFDENGCEMKKEQIAVNNSRLEISVEQNTATSDKPFKGGEVFRKHPVLYGMFQVRMKNKIVPGTVSSFFIMNEWKAENWDHKEIDIEFLGKNLHAVQFTVHHFKDGGNKHVYKEHTHHLMFDSSKEFHDYGILWSKDSISFSVNGNWVHSEREILINEPMNIRMNHWAANPDDSTGIKTWLGPVNHYLLPSKVYYDFVCYKPLQSLQ